LGSSGRIFHRDNVDRDKAVVPTGMAHIRFCAWVSIFKITGATAVV